MPTHFEGKERFAKAEDYLEKLARIRLARMARTSVNEIASQMKADRFVTDRQLAYLDGLWRRLGR